MLVLSSHLRSAPDLEAVLTAVDNLAEDGTRPILRLAGLPLLVEREPSVARAVEQLARRITDGGLELWNGGWAGADGDLLTAEEFSRDIEWGVTAPGESGLVDRLGQRPVATAPLRMTDRQLQLLAGGPVVAGSRNVSAPSDAPRQVYVLTGEGLRLGELVLLEVSDDRPLTAERRASLASTGAVRSDTRTWLGTLASAPPPAAGLWHLGGHRMWMRATGLAAAARLRAAESPSRERNRRVIRAAAGMPENAPPAPASTNPGADHELQGGVTGSLSLAGEGMDARVSGGRLAGLSAPAGLQTPPLRAQGFIREESRLDFLETVSGAWFTGTRVRGVHETAHIPGVLRLEAVLFAADGTPGLSISYTLYPEPVGAERASAAMVGTSAARDSQSLYVPMEVALAEYPVPVPDLSVTVYEADGVPHSTTLPPPDPSRLPGPDPQLARIPATAITLDLPGGPLTLRVVHPGAPIMLPFLFAWRGTTAGREDRTRLVWYPLGCGTPRLFAEADLASVSLSYRLEASAAVPALRCEPQLAGEIRGVSAEAIR